LGRKALLSRRIVTAEGIRPGALLINGEQIEAIVAIEDAPPDAIREDLGNLAVLPGLVDSHVHINEPGRTDWGGFQSVMRAAAAGGYTMLVDMPLNCIPATTNVKALEAKRQAAQGKCRVDWGAWGGIVRGNENEIELLADAGVLGFKCFLVHPGIEEFSMVDEPDLRAALPHLARTGLPLLVHAELPGPIDGATKRLSGQSWRRYETYLQSRPEEAEVSAIQLMLSLCREFRFRFHVVHLATAAALDMLQAAKVEGLPVTVETCPHYLHLEAETIPDGATQTKCAPPIRGRENRERLWRGLRDGIIDMVVTDHSPCPPAMKRIEEGDFQKAWGGIASLSMALPVIWTEAQIRGFSLLDLARWMSEKPARLAGCEAWKGRLAAGYDADFVVFDPENEFTVTEPRLHQGQALSPYLGERLRGVVNRTYVRGREVYREGEFLGDPQGRELRTTRTSAGCARVRSREN
jgi:allantoinase